MVVVQQGEDGAMVPSMEEEIAALKEQMQAALSRAARRKAKHSELFKAHEQLQQKARGLQLQVGALEEALEERKRVRIVIQLDILGLMVTPLASMAQRLVSLRRPTK